MVWNSRNQITRVTHGGLGHFHCVSGVMWKSWSMDSVLYLSAWTRSRECGSLYPRLCARGIASDSRSVLACTRLSHPNSLSVFLSDQTDIWGVEISRVEKVTETQRLSAQATTATGNETAGNVHRSQLTECHYLVNDFWRQENGAENKLGILLYAGS